MYTLENNFALSATHIQNAFVAQHFRAVDVYDGAQEVFELGWIKGSFGFKNKAFDVIVMVVVMARAASCVMGMFAVGVVIMVTVVTVVTVVMVVVPMVVSMRIMSMFVRRMVTMLTVVVMVAIVCQEIGVNV